MEMSLTAPGRLVSKAEKDVPELPLEYREVSFPGRLVCTAETVGKLVESVVPVR